MSQTNLNDTPPDGIVAILTDANGTPLAIGTSFSKSTPGGFTLRQAQEHRARDNLAKNTIIALASPVLANAIDPHTAGQILGTLCRQGCTVSITPVGHAE